MKRGESLPELIEPENLEEDESGILEQKGEVLVAGMPEEKEEIVKQPVHCLGSKREQEVPYLQTKGWYIEAQVENQKCVWHIDSGSCQTMVPYKVYQDLPAKLRPRLWPLSGEFEQASGSSLPNYGRGLVWVQFQGIKVQHWCVFADVAQPLLGLDFIQLHEAPFDALRGTLELGGVILQCWEGNSRNWCARVAAFDYCTVPANSEAIVRSRLLKPQRMKAGTLGCVEGTARFKDTHQMIVANELVDLTKGELCTRVYNPSDEDKTIYRGTHLALVSPALVVGVGWMTEPGREDQNIATLKAVDGSPHESLTPDVDTPDVVDCSEGTDAASDVPRRKKMFLGKAKNRPVVPSFEVPEARLAGQKREFEKKSYSVDSFEKSCFVMPEGGPAGTVSSVEKTTEVFKSGEHETPAQEVFKPREVSDHLRERNEVLAEEEFLGDKSREDSNYLRERIPGTCTQRVCSEMPREISITFGKEKEVLEHSKKKEVLEELRGEVPETLEGRNEVPPEDVFERESFKEGQTDALKPVLHPSLVEMLSRVDESVTIPERKEVTMVIGAYEYVFSKHEFDLGRTALTEHGITLKDETPIREALRRQNFYVREQIQDHIEELAEMGVIQPSESPWRQQIVPVQKSDGKWRLCVDYRKLNDKTVKDAYPMPRIEENIDALSHSQWFSSLDLTMGYHQVPMKAEDKAKTAFAAPSGGLYEYNTMPFGLCNAPGTFERLMERVLNKLQWHVAVLYLDDIIVYGRTWEEHMRNLELVLQRVGQAGLKLKPKKCQLCQKRVKFLGHYVSAEGVEVNPEKIKAVVEMPRPTNVTGLRAFLGLTSYYRKFIKDFSEIAKPLHAMTSQKGDLQWTPESVRAFEKLKRVLTRTPILAYPDMLGEEFILDTDASGFAIGAVLSQVQEGQERVIAYASRTLSEEEQRYCTTRRELLAVVTFVKHFRPYLRARHFLLRTDHGPLTWLHTTKNIQGQSFRWIRRLAEYQFLIQHRAGKKHANADALSRLPQPETSCKDCDMDHSEYTGPTETEIETLREKAKQRDEELDTERLEERKKLQAAGHVKDFVLQQVSAVYHDDRDYEEEDQEVEEDEGPRPRKAKVVPKTVETPKIKKKRGRVPNRPAKAEAKIPDEPEAWDLDFIRTQQEEDEVISTLVKRLKMFKTKPKWEDIVIQGAEYKYWWSQWELLVEIEGILYYKWVDSENSYRLKIVIPRKLVGWILWCVHDSPGAGHFGQARTYK